MKNYKRHNFMSYRLPIITMLVGLIFATFSIINIINSHQQTAIFKACPDSEYCEYDYYADEDGNVSINYSGWPFKIKVGNPDWCDTGSEGICEGNNFHPSFEYKWRIYNVLILSAPMTLLIITSAYFYNKVRIKKFLLLVALLIIHLVFGWFTMFQVTVATIRSADEDIYGPVHIGMPFYEENHLASGCNLYEMDAKIECERDSFQQFTQFWDAPITTYINWLFWSLILFTLTVLVYKYFSLPYLRKKHTKDSR